ncbi:MAG TPA: cupredoxin family protein [Nitrosospira sp.]|jgi:uncharacterized cupredoxin-like copper-binding protein|nr:cupredoxin family protein [Nitrosospira sp.]
MKRILLVSALTCVISTGAFADEEAASPGNPGNSAQMSRTIEVTMEDNRFKPSEINVKQGETIKFRLKNAGKKKHEMVIGTPEELDKHAKMMKKFPDMEHSEPNMITVDPGKTGELIWQFTEAGTVNFECTLPGHFKEMRGTVLVEAK